MSTAYTVHIRKTAKGTYTVDQPCHNWSVAIWFQPNRGKQLKHLGVFATLDLAKAAIETHIATSK